MGKSIVVRAAVHAVDEGLDGGAVLGERGHGCSSSCRGRRVSRAEQPTITAGYVHRAVSVT
jgi:hypothetical protein